MLLLLLLMPKSPALSIPRSTSYPLQLQGKRFRHDIKLATDRWTLGAPSTRGSGQSRRRKPSAVAISKIAPLSLLSSQHHDPTTATSAAVIVNERFLVMAFSSRDSRVRHYLFITLVRSYVAPSGPHIVNS